MNDFHLVAGKAGSHLAKRELRLRTDCSDIPISFRHDEDYQKAQKAPYQQAHKWSKTPCTGDVGGLGDTGGGDTEQSIFLTPGKAGETVFSCVDSTFTTDKNFITIET